MPGLAVVFVERNLGVGGGPTTTANILPQASTTTVFQPVETSNDNGAPSITKTALEWVFAIAALLVISSLFSWRWYQVRRRQHPANLFIAPSPARSQRRSPYERPYSRPIDALMLEDGIYREQPAFPRPMAVALVRPEISSGARGRRAATGLDIDAQGRRRAEGRGGEDGEEDKDELPAYDNIGGPPKYFDAATGMLIEDPSMGIGMVTLRTLSVDNDQDHDHDAEGRMSGESSNSIGRDMTIETNVPLEQAPMYTPTQEEASPAPPNHENTHASTPLHDQEIEHPHTSEHSNAEHTSTSRPTLPENDQSGR